MDLGGPRPPQRTLREPAAQHADGCDLRLPRSDRVVRRVADRDGFSALDPELL